jgi:hypothetical protein
MSTMGADGLALSEFLPACRFVIVDARRGDVPHAAANDKDSIVRLMQALPEVDRENMWVLDRLAQDRAPFDQPRNRGITYGWKN